MVELLNASEREHSERLLIARLPPAEGGHKLLVHVH